MSASTTGRWTQYNEDTYCLPPGLKRIGHDSDDTEEYFFTGGWKSAPGVLAPVDSNADTCRGSSSASTSTAPELKTLPNPAVSRLASSGTIVKDLDSDSGEDDLAGTPPRGTASTGEGSSELDPNGITVTSSTPAPDDGSSDGMRRRKTWKDQIKGFPDRLKSSGSHIVRRPLSGSSSRKHGLGITIEQDARPTPPPKDRHSPDPTISPTRKITFSDMGLIKARDL